jgi:hypothetical protein
MNNETVSEIEANKQCDTLSHQTVSELIPNKL